MNNFLLIAIPLIAAWALLSLFYQAIVRPVLNDMLRFRLFAVRDQLRALAIDDQILASNFSYQHLERLLCRLVDCSTWLSVSTMIELEIRHGALKPTVDMLRFEQEAPKELRDLRHSALVSTSFALVVNSPGWSLLAAIIGGIATLFGWAGKKWVEVKTAIFIEQDWSADCLPNG